MDSENTPAQNTAAHERYLYKPFKGSSHSWAQKILFEESSTSALLDIGAGSGAIGRELKEKNFSEIYAIEVDPKSKEHILPFYKEVKSDLKDLSRSDFDLILLLDVLEHVTNPEKLLDAAAAHLKPGGKILISLPNVAHWSVRLPLLFGQFNYKERGILDKTHINFYTRSSAKRFLESRPGLKIASSSASIEPLELLLPKLIYDNKIFELLSGVRISLAELLPGFFAYQNLFVLKKS